MSQSLAHAAVLEMKRWEKTRAAILELMQPGDELTCTELAERLGVSRKYIINMSDDLCDEGFHLHIADGCGGGVFERPKKNWSLFRDYDE